MPVPSPPPVAIVGIGCLFPGAPDLASYWRNITLGADCISDVPDGHSWSVADYYDADPTAADKTWCTRGGFLEPVPFEPIRHGVPPAMLESIDTTQLLSLLVAREALRDARLDPDGAGWDRDRTACIIGITGTQELAITCGSRLQGPIWRRSLLRCGVDEQLADAVVADIANHFPAWTEQSFPGLLGNVVAGRIANRLDLGGTNAVVDAACASSLAAIQYAISDLHTGRSDLVLTGGADTLNDIFMFECFTRTPAFTKKGDARPFDASADGILIGEGIAITALKRLEDAERDGDRVYAVIKGVGSSSDGRSGSIYAPNPSGQAKALRRTYAMAGIDPRTVELVEAHGTGTKAGDAAEVRGLQEVYGADAAKPWCALGSVKSQIGHTKSTAGAAGLVKAALALHQRVLPPTAKVARPNPKLGLRDSPFYVLDRARPWVRAADHPRRAAVSAFGFGGSNYHAVLEEHGDAADAAAMAAAGVELFLIGAADRAGLAAAIEALDPAAGPTLAHAARAVLEAWQPGAAHVCAFTASTLEELAVRRRRALARVGGDAPRPGDHVHLSDPDAPAPSLALLFPGQGSQYLDMGRQLALRYPQVRAALDAVEEALRARGAPSLHERLYPLPAWEDGEREAQELELQQTLWAQLALGAVSKGMADLLAAFGARADAVAGHSYGELVALYAAGVLDADGLWAATFARASAMQEVATAGAGTMAAITGPLDGLEAQLPAGVVVANRNHPGQAVISGPTAAVEAAVERLEAGGFSAKRLRVAAAFHSPLMEPATGPYAAALRNIPLEPPRIDAISNVTAAPHAADPDAIRDLLARQLTAPVDFAGSVVHLERRGTTLFVECGPRGVLTGLVGATTDVEALALDGAADREDGDLQLKRALARLAAAGVPIDCAPLLAQRPPAAPRAAGRGSVWLTGANHRTPETLDPPMPDLPKRPPAPTAEPSGWAALPSSGAEIAKPPPLATAPAPTAPAPTPAAPAAALPDAGALSALLASTQQTLAAFQQAQERTAEVHERFLDTYAKATDQFAKVFDTHARLVQLAAAGGIAAAPRTAPRAAPAPIPTVPAPQPAPPPPAPPEPDVWEVGRVFSPDGAMTAVATDLPPIFDAQAALDQSAAARSAPATAPRAAVPRDELVPIVLAAIAEKTGYATDMLELGMDLEADLGVDSIKRVEILSAVRERRPDLPELDNDRMSAVRTLSELVGLLEDAAPPAPAIEGPALTDAVLAAIAEKTGYATDMLELGMDLEADLGVDSIKRVEILSAVREARPDLPELDSEQMGALRTVSEVVTWLQARVGAPALLRPPAPIDRDALVRATLGAVAEKTGYDVDMLELGMDLEADLGVDSIKRVEILSAVRTAVPDLPELEPDALASLRTLQDVVDHLASLSAGLGFAMLGAHASPEIGRPLLIMPPAAPTPPLSIPAPPPPVQTAGELLAPERGLRRREVVITTAPDGSPAELRGPVVVTGDRGKRAEALVRALRARDIDANVARPRSWRSARSIRTALPEDAAAVVHLAALGATGPALADRVRGALVVAQAVGPTCALFATVSGRGGRFGRTEGGAADEGALAGLTKTLHREWSDTRALAIDIDAAAFDAEALAAELCTDRGVLEVGLADGAAWTLWAQPAPAPTAVALPLEPGDLVVASGGARGVTAACLEALAQRVPIALLVLGRTEAADADPAWAADVLDAELPAAAITHLREAGATPAPKDVDAQVRAVLGAREVRRTLASLRATGAQVRYASVDVRDAAAVGRQIAASVDQHGPVRGLVHGAGVLADKLVVDKTMEQVERVWSTKVAGLDALLAAIEPEELRAAALFCSVAGRFGNAGQSDYAMANEALVQRALELQRTTSARVVAVDWGPWDGGMVTPGLRRQFEARGHALIPIEAGARALWDEIAGAGPVEVVLEAALPERGQQVRTAPTTSPWLADHVIGARSVVPVAMVVEWIADIAQAVYPELHLGAVRELAVLSGLGVDAPAPLTVHLAWSPALDPEDAAALDFALSTPSGPGGAERIHYRARVELTRQTPSAAPFPGSNGLGAEPYPYAVEEAYRRFLFHGPSLQGIDEIVGISDSGMVAWLQTSAPARLGVPGSEWRTDPLAVDSALQLMLLWVREKQGLGALPSAVGDYRQYRPFRGRVACHLEVDRIDAHSGRFAATLVDEDGAVVARLHGGAYTAGPTLAEAFATSEP